jgi:transcription elongation factor GreA
MGKQTYITREGFERLTHELNELKTAKRKEIAGRIQEAKELGDLSENAEYAEAKNEQAFVEGRILELSAMLKEAVIIDNTHNHPGEVQVGSTVTVKGPKGTQSLTIVGSNEADPTAGRISNESPLGAALLARRAGDRVTLQVPAGTSEYAILAIR